MKLGIGGIIKRLMLVWGMLLFGWAGTLAQEVRDTTHVHFRQSVSVVDTLYVIHGEPLPAFVERNKARFNDSTFILKHIQVVGSASPEGVLRFNETLAQ